VRISRLRASAAASPALVGIALLMIPFGAIADVSKQQCIAADTSAQSLRRGGKFAAAREQLRICGDPTCPDLVRGDCARRTSELDRAQPTIVFDAKDRAGNDLSAVKVSIDGQPVASKVAGTALPVDPGEHSFTFEAPGQPPVTRSFVLKEGDRERRERIVVGAATAAPLVGATSSKSPGAGTSSPEASRASPGDGSSQRTWGLVAGGVGIAGLAVGTVFGLLAANANNAQNSDCSSSASLATCPHHAQALSDHATTVTDGTISTIAFVAGGALALTGAILFFNAPSPSTESLGVVPAVGPNVAGLSIAGRF